MSQGKVSERCNRVIWKPKKLGLFPCSGASLKGNNRFGPVLNPTRDPGWELILVHCAHAADNIQDPQPHLFEISAGHKNIMPVTLTSHATNHIATLYCFIDLRPRSNPFKTLKKLQFDIYTCKCPHKQEKGVVPDANPQPIGNTVPLLLDHHHCNEI